MLKSNRERLQSYALVGMRTRIAELLEESVELKLAFPNVRTLAQVQAALSATIDELDGSPRRRVPRAKPELRVEIPDVTNGARRAKQATKRRISPGATESARLKSWLTGRDVLALLTDHDGGLTIPEIAKKLKMQEQATYYRLRVRAKHGHAKIVDPDKKLWAITADGRTALRNDRDSEL